VRQKRQSFIPVFSLILAAASCSGPQAPSKATISDLQANIDKGPPPFVAKDPLSQNHWESTRQVYTLRQFQPVLSSTDVVLQALQNASADGLNPEDFDVGGLQTLRDSLKSSPDSAKENELDLHLTYSLVRYVSQLCFGRIDPRMINPEWPETGRNCDVDQIVFDALQKNTVENLSEQLSPGIPEYQGLKKTLQRYRDIAAQGGWQTVQGEVSKERGSRGVPDGALLAATLEGTGDLETSVGNETPSRAAVREALARFQARHGLESKKALDAKTLAAMNVPIEQRIEQIEINMDRMRWIAHRLEPKHVLVNVPGFQLSVHDGDQIPLQMRAIVGSMENPTPIMDDQIEYVVFSPYWNIPISIAVKEFLPKIKRDRNYLRSQELEVVRTSGGKAQVVEPSKVAWDKVEDAEYQLRQKPGTKNALGLVKFMFPNSYNVYLHDTPSGNLFDRLTRSLSHGCVRIEHPADLAAYVLQDQPEWTPERIEEAMHAEKEQNVPLKTKLPIHVVYWTAWADAEGNAQFREDVYGFDQKHRELVSKTVNASSPSANPSGVNMHKVGRRVVAHAAALDGQSRLPEK
jgi:murein L,D-transpeptidase YcbB/YkuD